MTDQVAAPAVSTLQAPAEFRLVCDVCAEPLMFSRMTTTVAVRSDDIVGDDEGCVCRLTYLAECGAEREIELTAGCLIIVHETVPHGG